MPFATAASWSWDVLDVGSSLPSRLAAASPWAFRGCSSSSWAHACREGISLTMAAGLASTAASPTCSTGDGDGDGDGVGAVAAAAEAGESPEVPGSASCCSCCSSWLERGKLHLACFPRIFLAASSYLRAASFAVLKVPNQSLIPFLGSRISAAHLPQGLRRTPRKWTPLRFPETLVAPFASEAHPIPPSIPLAHPAILPGPRLPCLPLFDPDFCLPHVHVPKHPPPRYPPLLQNAHLCKKAFLPWKNFLFSNSSGEI
mmetsp:Transcript_2688/g.9910  ORF Transcript_2688/g.9910 Transcript_2688/m.9910 type:complete len:258 (+) Transcript_2688:1465-2238(+)